jgi:STE24 endopeptidase
VCRPIAAASGGRVPMQKKLLLIVLFFCLLLGLGLGFATRPGTKVTGPDAIGIQPMDEAWRARLPHDPEAATEAYMARVSPAAEARANAYFRGGYWLQLWSLLVTLGSAWILLHTGASAAMRDWAERVTRRKPLQTMLYTLPFLFATWLLALPLSVFAGFMREHWYGMATQRFGPWMWEQVIGFTVSLVFVAILAAIVYGVIRKAPRTWWLWATGVSMVFMAFALFISPVLVDPLFNTYKPLAEGPVKASVLSLARANGVPVEDVYQFDASKQTTRISANVSGIFGTTAVRLNDNLLNRCTLPEIRGVLAHELGHYVLNHTYKIFLFFTFILVGGFAFAKWGFESARTRWGQAWQIRDIGDVAGVPLLVAIFSVYFFLASPIVNTLIRVQEVEADIFALNACPEPDAIADVELKLVEYRNANPGPVEEFLFCDHPSPRDRVYAAMRWKAEHFQKP